MLALFSGITAEKVFGFSYPLAPGRLLAGILPHNSRESEKRRGGRWHRQEKQRELWG
jgi:hypothetical protein